LDRCPAFPMLMASATLPQRHSNWMGAGHCSQIDKHGCAWSSAHGAAGQRIGNKVSKRAIGRSPTKVQNNAVARLIDTSVPWGAHVRLTPQPFGLDVITTDARGLKPNCQQAVAAHCSARSQSPPGSGSCRASSSPSVCGVTFREQSLSSRNQIGSRHVHRRGQLEHCCKGRHVLATFNLADVTALDPGEVCKGLLSDSPSRSGGTDG